VRAMRLIPYLLVITVAAMVCGLILQADMATGMRSPRLHAVACFITRTDCRDETKP
jgi:undecaprenyl pyrophosphate phosphatase UppP